MKIYKKLSLILILIFLLSSLTYAGEVTESEKKGKMPPAGESEGAKDSVESKNALQEKEKEQSKSEKEEENKDSEQEKDEENENQTREDEKTLKIQGFSEDYQQIKSWLEKLLGRPLDLNNPKDKAIYDFWCGLLNQGYKLDQIHSLIETVGLAKKTIDFWYNGYFFQMGKVELDDINDMRALFNWANLITMGFSPQDVRLLIIVARVSMQEIKDYMIHRDLDVRNAQDVRIIAGWSLYRKQGYSAQQVYNLFKDRLIPEIKKLIPNFDIRNAQHAGFFTFWIEDALSRLGGGLDYVCNLLNAMAQIRSEVEALIGRVDFLDNYYEDNGFITYWAEKALAGKEEFIFNNNTYTINWSIQYVKDFLTVLKDLNKRLTNPINVLDPNDMGRVTNWIHYILTVKGVTPGQPGYETLLQEVVRKLEQEGPAIEALKPLVIDLFNKLGISYDDNNPLHHGYLMFWVSKALSGEVSPVTNKTWSIDYAKQVLANMTQLIDYVIPILNKVGAKLDIFDPNNKANGYLTFWAEKALANPEQFIYNNTTYMINWSLNYVKDFLTVVLDINTRLKNKIDLFDDEDMGRLSYWANYILTVKGVRPGMPGYLNLIEEAVRNLEEIPGIAGELKPYVIDLFNKLGISYDENNPAHKGFLEYWARLVAEEVVDEDGFVWTLENTKAVLDYMAEIVNEVINLIGEINLFDDNYNDNGFLTFWAKEIVKGNRTLESTELLLSDMAYLRPVVERGIGRTLDLFNPDDSGLLTYWANEVQRLMDEEGLSHDEALARVEQIIRDTYNVQGNITFYMNNDEVVFFDKDGNILFRYQLPEDLDHTEYKPLYVLISPDDRHAVIIWGRIEHTSQINPHHPDRHYFYYTKIVFGDNPRVDVIMGNFYGKVNKALMTPDGNYLMIGFSDDSLPDKVMFINLTNNSQIKTTPLQGGPGRIVDMITAPDSKRMYLISDNACVTIFDPQTGNVLATIETPWYYTFNWQGKLYISDDGEILTIVDKDGNEVKYNVEDLNNIYQIEEIPEEIKEALIPYIEQLLGQPYDENNPQHQGFLTYWAERAVNEGLDKIETLLDAMVKIKPEVEALIGTINFLDDNHNDNGFLTYWAEQAIEKGIDYIKQHLYIWNRLIPSIEQKLGRELALFNAEDTGIIDFWANKVEEIMAKEGLSLEDAIQKVIELILQEQPTIYDMLIPYIEELLDITFDQNNPQHQGFLTYWTEYAMDVGIDTVKTLLSNMAEIKPHLELLVGEINLLDDNYDDNGLLTFWAEYAKDNGLQQTITIINNMVQIKDEIEALLGRVDLYDHQYGDNGFLTYWAEYALDVGVDRVETLLRNMAELKSYVEAVIGEIDFLDDNYDDNGFITFWAEYAHENGLQKAKDLLTNMKAILTSDWDNNGTSDIEELIGKINFFDSNYEDNGFLTYWAESTLSRGVEDVNMSLYIWKRLLPYVNEHEGRELDLFDPNDSGIISYWEGRVRELMQNQGLSLESAIQEVINILTGGTSTASFL